MATATFGRVFLTGGAGFIGSHLADYLLDSGHNVTVYDNLSLGRRAWVEHNLGKSQYAFVQADLLDAAALREAMPGHDVVFHLGANTDIPRGNRDPRIDLDNCVVATHNVLEAMRSLNIRNVIFASSSTVFGEVDVHPTPENIGPMLPISLYGAGKMACEGFISAYSHLFGIRAVMYRFGNVVGARVGHGVIYDFVQKLKRNPEELEVLGDGEQEKNYFLVEDCIGGMIHGFTHSPSQCDVFNLGSDTTVKVKEIARIVADEMGLENVRIRYTGGRRGWPGDVPLVMYDMNKMRRLGWVATHTSAEAVRIAVRRLLEQWV
jgi:UDP-glucose 4-epimerase